MSAVARRARLMDALYRAYGEAATWTPADGGEAISCAVRPEAPDTEIRLGPERVRAATRKIRVRLSEVATVAKGDQVEITSGPVQGVFKVLARPPADAYSVEWVCELGPA